MIITYHSRIILNQSKYNLSPIGVELSSDATGSPRSENDIDKVKEHLLLF